MLPGPHTEPVPGFVAILRLRSSDVPGLMGRLRDAVAILATREGFVDARIGRAIDDGELITMQLAWESVGAYRRALSSYDVKVHVVPLMSEALDEPTAFEVLHVTDEGGASDAIGALAGDAGTVSLGEAASVHVPPAPS